MAPKYQTASRVQREALRKSIKREFDAMTRDGSARTAVYEALSKKYKISPSTVRNYANGR